MQGKALNKAQLQHLLTRFLHLKGVNQLHRVAQRFIQDNGTRNAAALTYTSLFAVVPMLMVIYSMLAALPVFKGIGDELQIMLFDHLVPTTGVVIQDYMSEFAKQARHLTLVGAIVLLVTAGMMIVSIEKAFNQIWRVEKPRRGLQAFLIYWSVLTLGPLLLGAGVMLSSYLNTLPLIAQLDGFTGGGISNLWQYLPLMFSFLAFTLLYWAVPNCSVRLRDALVGGVAMAFLFESAKRVFAWFVGNFPSYEFIYGAFAAFPLFLLWMYISWVMILLCAQWVAVRGLPKETLQEDDLEPSLQMLIVLKEIWQAFAQAKGIEENRLRNLVASKNADEWHVRMHWMQENNWVTFDAERKVWLPGRDFNRISFASWLTHLPWRLPPVETWPATLQELHLLSERLHAIQQLEASSLNLPLSDLITPQAEEKQP